MTVKGRIHSIESCGAVDGPGIRFIAFFQGCLMRCKYCHNRDTWDTDTGKEVTVEELMKDLLSYRHYMAASGGGVTASGGEATLQMEFVTAWFKACREQGINTCLDTNGFIRAYDEKLEALLAETDLVMLDIKHMNDDIHIPLTHVSNKYSLEFARYLARKDQKLWLRYVIVPQWTDDDAGAHALGKFIRDDLNGKVERVELLPYHALGQHKWTDMGEKYELEGIEPPTKESMAHIKEIIRSYGANIL